MPLISVIVPIYNVDVYLAECLNSLCNQSFDDFEVILINDGSTDGSRAIAEDFSRKDPRFQLINTSNGGLSVARNTGMNHARGAHTTFVDSDDLLAPEALREMQVYCDKHDLDAIFYSADSFTDDSSNPLPRNRYCRPDLLTNKIMTGVDFFIKSVHSNSYWPSACLYLVRREIAEEIKFVPNIYHEDNLYTTQLLSHPHLVRLMAVNSPLYLSVYMPVLSLALRRT